MGGCVKGEDCPFSHDLASHADSHSPADVQRGYVLVGAVKNATTRTPTPPPAPPALSADAVPFIPANSGVPPSFSAPQRTDKGGGKMHPTPLRTQGAPFRAPTHPGPSLVASHHGLGALYGAPPPPPPSIAAAAAHQLSAATLVDAVRLRTGSAVDSPMHMQLAAAMAGDATTMGGVPLSAPPFHTGDATTTTSMAASYSNQSAALALMMSGGGASGGVDRLSQALRPPLQVNGTAAAAVSQAAKASFGVAHPMYYDDGTTQIRMMPPTSMSMDAVYGFAGGYQESSAFGGYGHYDAAEAAFYYGGPHGGGAAELLMAPNSSQPQLLESSMAFRNRTAHRYTM